MAVVSILMYHRITATADERSAMAVPLGDFAAQMALLAREQIPVYSLGEALALQRAGRPSPGPSVVLTFDDGYAATCRRAEAVLARYGYEATLYLTSDLVGRRDPLGEPGEGALHWGEVRRLRQFRVEAHTASHPWLAALDRAGVRREVRESKDRIEQELGRAVDHFAYPFGSFTGRVRAEVRAAGYASAATVRRGPLGTDPDPWRLNRVTVDGRDALAIFARKVRTGYGSRREHAASRLRDALVRLPGVHDLAEWRRATR